MTGEYSSRNISNSQCTETKTFKSSFPVSVPAGKIYRGSAKVNNPEVEVPYEGTIYFEGEITKIEYGTYRGGAEMYELIWEINDITDEV